MHSCHEKINTILKTVLRKLQMDRKVEMKAYSMVKQMLIDHDQNQVDYSKEDYYGEDVGRKGIRPGFHPRSDRVKSQK